MPGTLVEQTLASFAEHGERVAIRVETPGGALVDWTYRELLARVHREARRLGSAGVGRGAVVAIMAGDDPMTFVLRWAANVRGAAVAVLPDGHSAAALSELVDAVDARFVLTDAARAPTARALGARVAVVDVDAAPPPPDDGPVAVDARPGDLASISLTGGSTGVPKGVPRHAAVPPYASPAALAGWRDVVQLLCTPVAHIGGTVAQIVLAAGGRVVLHRGFGFDPGRVLAAIARERVTTVQLMPGLLHRLLDHPDLPTTDTSSLRTLRIGSAPASAARIGEALERFGPVVGQTYGSIEATTITTIGADELARPGLRGTVGRPVPGVELAIRDGDDRDLPTGALGEVCVRSPAVMPGYVGDPDGTAEVLRDGWLHTGDLGRLDDGGYLTLVGRATEMIIAEEATLHPAEVENVLLAHPGVAAAAVVGVTDADGTESAAAAVVARRGHRPGPDELIAWVSRHRGPHRAPSEAVLVDDLPTTPSGKLDRAATRAMVAPLTRRGRSGPVDR